MHLSALHGGSLVCGRPGHGLLASVFSSFTTTSRLCLPLHFLYHLSTAPWQHSSKDPDHLQHPTSVVQPPTTLSNGLDDSQRTERPADGAGVQRKPPALAGFPRLPAGMARKRHPLRGVPVGRQDGRARPYLHRPVILRARRDGGEADGAGQRFS